MHKIFGLIPDNIDIISSFTHVSPNLRLQLFSGKPNKIFGEKCKKKMKSTWSLYVWKQEQLYV